MLIAFFRVLRLKVFSKLWDGELNHSHLHLPISKKLHLSTFVICEIKYWETTFTSEKYDGMLIVHFKLRLSEAA